MSQQMFSLLNGDDTAASLYSGELVISEGRAVNSQDFTLMASRSFAEEVVFCARRLCFSMAHSVSREGASMILMLAYRGCR